MLPICTMTVPMQGIASMQWAEASQRATAHRSAQARSTRLFRLGRHINSLFVVRWAGLAKDLVISDVSLCRFHRSASVGLVIAQLHIVCNMCTILSGSNRSVGSPGFERIQLPKTRTMRWSLRDCEELKSFCPSTSCPAGTPSRGTHAELSRLPDAVYRRLCMSYN